MTEITLRHNDRLWLALQGDIQVAEIYLDHRDQVDEVVLYAETSEELQLDILRLAASHVMQFVKYRINSVFGGLMTAEYSNKNLTSMDSSRLMNFAMIPEEIVAIDRNSIVREFRSLSIEIIIAVHKTANEAIEVAVSQAGIKSLRHKVVPKRTIFDNEMTLEFFAGRNRNFSFWRSESFPTNKEHELHIVPDYHPVMKEWEAVGMVNGATDAYIRGETVKSLYCPKQARVNTDTEGFGSSWNHVKHPYRASGHSFMLCLSTTKVRSAAGTQELMQLLRASLSLDEKYIEISGGFSAPLKCAHNRLLELGRKSPYPRANYSRGGNIARGSEEHCVWAYRTLEQEGELAKAHVPSWFIQEDWLGIYETAKVLHGLY
jgi:hypothetical protein